MSAERVELIGRALDAAEAEDRDEVARLAEAVVHPDCEFLPLIGAGLEGSYRGPDGMVEFFDDLLNAFEVRYVDRDLRPVGDESVLLLCQLQLRGRESEIEMVQELGTIYEFENGLLRAMRVYRSHAETLAAAEVLPA